MSIYICDKCEKHCDNDHNPCTETPKWLPVVSGLICEDCDTNLLKPDPLDLADTSPFGEE